MSTDEDVTDSEWEELPRYDLRPRGYCNYAEEPMSYILATMAESWENP